MILYKKYFTKKKEEKYKIMNNLTIKDEKVETEIKNSEIIKKYPYWNLHFCPVYKIIETFIYLLYTNFTVLFLMFPTHLNIKFNIFPELLNNVIQEKINLPEVE